VNKNTKWLIVILVVAAFLRLYKIESVPVSLFGDELDVGYHALSILKTGRDYQGNLMPLHFHSLAEWRTPLYLYSAVPTVALFGISSLGVRLPAAIFGVMGVWMMWLLVKKISGDGKVAILSSLVLAISPWHLQYSRAAFEVTMLLLFFLGGLYLFYKGLEDGRWLWLSALGLSLTPWIYSTAKLFMPFFILLLIVVYRKKLFELSKKYLAGAIVVMVFLWGVLGYTIVAGGAAQRFSYVGIFSDPTIEHEVGVARLNDARVRGELGEGLSPKLVDRLLHNKYVIWGDSIIGNYMTSYSFDFLFADGDPNLRHTIEGMGMFYAIEFVALGVGIVVFLAKQRDTKVKWLIVGWLVLAPLPAALTRDGGNHATRLILLLPPLVILIAYGVSKINKYIGLLYALGLLIGFIFYQHNYWFHNPWYSERWWHAGYEQAIDAVKKHENEYDKVVISTVNEPPWIFFAGWYEYPPDRWQKEFPIGNDIQLEGFGRVSHIDKFYFGNLEKYDFYEWDKILDEGTLYLAVASEAGVNLIMEPGRLPSGLRLIEAIAYPSGEPAFYLVSKKG